MGYKRLCPLRKVPDVPVIQPPNGGIKPRCVYEGGDWSIHNGDTLDSAWKDMDKLRQKFINGERS